MTTNEIIIDILPNIVFQEYSIIDIPDNYIYNTITTTKDIDFEIPDYW